MIDSPDKIQWHPAFYAATGLELKDNIDELQLIPEYNLSKEPIRIDLLIMKDYKNNPIKNEIGHLWKTYNVIEYKSPDDGLTIDDFYKTLGYACLYKGLGEHVGQIPTDELTVSLFRDVYPRELMLSLEKEGHSIEEKYPGIYYVTGKITIMTQIIVTSQLTPESHSSFRVLSNRAKREDIELFLKNSRNETNQGCKNNIEAVLQASVSANYELYEEVRRDMVMCQALQELLKDEINEKVTEGKIEGKIEDIKSLMETLKLTAEQAMNALKIPVEEQAALMRKI